MFCFYPEACTTALVSGKFTPDGRPLLFKQRDTDELHNKIEFFHDGRYDYVGLVNSKDPSHAVWGGYNSTGFAIINSASYNLNEHDQASVKDNEGIIMKLALQRCRTVRDFEQLLDSLPKPLGVEANFGVIDAQGGGAYFETGNSHFKKYDVNDPAVAPDGYIIRTNFSFSGNRSHGIFRNEKIDLKRKNTQLSPIFKKFLLFFDRTFGKTSGQLKKRLPDSVEYPYPPILRDINKPSCCWKTFPT